MFLQSPSMSGLKDIGASMMTFILALTIGNSFLLTKIEMSSNACALAVLFGTTANPTSVIARSINEGGYGSLVLGF